MFRSQTGEELVAAASAAHDFPSVILAPPEAFKDAQVKLEAMHGATFADTPILGGYPCTKDSPCTAHAAVTDRGHAPTGHAAYADVSVACRSCLQV